MKVRVQTKGGLVLELTLDTDANCLFTNGNTASTYSVSDVNYVGQMVEFEERFNQSFRSMLSQQGGIQFHGTTYRSHQYNFTSAASGSAVVPVAERSKSIKALYTIFRRSDVLNDDEKYAISRRCSNDVENVQWKIGSNVFPSQPVKGSSTDKSQFVAELVKAVSSLGDVRMGSVINNTNFAIIDVSAAFGTAFYGLDLESYAAASDILESGESTPEWALIGVC